MGNGTGAQGARVSGRQLAHAEGTGVWSPGESHGPSGMGMEAGIEQSGKHPVPDRGGRELGSAETGAGGILRGARHHGRDPGLFGGGGGHRPAGWSRGEGGGCAAEATALSLPGRKEAGKGAAAAAVLEYSVRTGGERGATVAPRGGGGAGARRERAELRD